MEPLTRNDCLRCRRPPNLCICATIVRVANRTPVSILQHPRERRHAFNTVRIARLALERVDVRVAHDIVIEPLHLPPDAALLYPASDAELLRTEHAPSHLVVLDGTWPQAKSLYKANPWLHKLRHVQLAPEAPSAYQIRREPAEHCLSSIESIAQALAICEPDNPQIEELLHGFHALVAGQVGHAVGRKSQPRRAKKSKANMRQRLVACWKDAVVVYAETTLRGDSREVLQLAAHRIHTGEVFDQLAQVRAVPNSCVLEHMLLCPDEVAAAVPFEELAAGWRDFRRPDDLYLAWSDGAVRTALACLGDSRPVGPLKSMYCNLRRGPSGRPDQVLEREGVSATPCPVRGRAAQRLGNAAALAGWLRLQA